MNTFQKVTSENLQEHVGNQAELYCQVGVLCSITGKLERGTLAQWQVRMSNDQTVGFSFGEFRILPNKTVEIRVS